MGATGLMVERSERGIYVALIGFTRYKYEVSPPAAVWPVSMRKAGL
jgi:hypothetical protein